MACPYYNRSPSYYGYCAAKAELERRAHSRGVTYESDGYLDYESYHCYDCYAGNTKYKNCPRYRSC